MTMLKIIRDKAIRYIFIIVAFAIFSILYLIVRDIMSYTIKLPVRKNKIEESKMPIVCLSSKLGGRITVTTKKNIIYDIYKLYPSAKERNSVRQLVLTKYGHFIGSSRDGNFICFTKELSGQECSVTQVNTNDLCSHSYTVRGLLKNYLLGNSHIIVTNKLNDILMYDMRKRTVAILDKKDLGVDAFDDIAMVYLDDNAELDIYYVHEKQLFCFRKGALNYKAIKVSSTPLNKAVNNKYIHQYVGEKSLGFTRLAYYELLSSEKDGIFLRADMLKGQNMCQVLLRTKYGDDYIVRYIGLSSKKRYVLLLIQERDVNYLFVYDVLRKEAIPLLSLDKDMDIKDIVFDESA